MIKTVALVSLSAGTIGEDFVKHEVNIGLKRLEQFGLNVKIMPHAMKGIEYVKNHPKERAEMIHIDFFHICLKTMNLKMLLKKQKREKYFLDFQILQ